jgi:Uma2 family endonuclease
MSTLVAPHVHLWTRNEYHQMAELGWFARQRVELIEGQVIDMSPMGSEHATAVALTAKAVEQVFGTGYFVRWQMPFGVGELSEPEPDVAVIAGDIRDYTAGHPTSAVLIVEVADTSLVYDRTEKASLYAKAGVTDYWVLNLVDRQLEVYRHAIPASESPYGFRYANATVLTVEEHVTPLGLQHASIAIADLLP